ncbi:MAG: glutamate--tRNA ligase, partial [Longimicrobiales bacterium]|nr:glutamate--tRNA ligase [Longimicrobiales bacterium]
MSEAVRARFAPSPTGYLHVGGARTALFNWLFARHHGGTFVLRIEDTDRARSSDEMVAAILEGMEWLGLDWDEGPVHQADGLERHRQDALRLLEEGRAYRCFCSPERLQAKREAAEAAGGGYRYDRHCRLEVSDEESEERAAAGEPFVVRFEVPEGGTVWEDAVHGETRFDNAEIDDFIILRTDGTPIYNLAVVSDDHEMAISHVIRGDDHLSNTPKQILLYDALGWSGPTFAHVPLILGPDGKRLSKRHGATAVGEYRHEGILPAAMVNFLALLGWSPGDDTEVMTVDALVDRFSLDRINKKSAVFDTEKLEWLNGRYLAEAPAAELAPMVVDRLVASGVDPEELARREEWLLGLIDLLKTRARTVNEVADQARVYLVDELEYEDKAVAKHWAKKPDEVAERLRRLREAYGELDAWELEPLEDALRGLADELGVGAGKVIHPLRLALTGSSASPGIFQVLMAIGRERSLARIEE